MESELSTPRTRRESEVWQACDDLWAQTAQTRNLTGDNIRDQLLKLGYKRGSPNEIYRYRSSWKESRGVIEQGEAAEPGAMTSDPISRAVSMVYDQMRTQTNEAMDKLVEDYEAKLKLALIEIETLKEDKAALCNEKSDLTQQLINSQTKNAKLEFSLAEQERERIVLCERIKGTSQLNETIQLEHQSLVLELKTFHEREIDLWRAQVNDTQKALGESKHESKLELERQGAKFSEELMQLKNELRQAYEEKAIAAARASALENALASTQKATQQHEVLLATKQLELRDTLIELEKAKLMIESESKEKLKWQRTVERYLQRNFVKRHRSFSK